MDAVTVLLMWVLLSFPIVRAVNKRLEEKGDEIRFQTWFQLILFFRAQIEVPFYYSNLILNFIKK